MRDLQPERTKNLSVGSRFSTVIAIACFVAMTACGEPSGPRTICCSPQPEPPTTFSGLSVLAAELHDAADVFAEGVDDEGLRAKTELAVNRLADELLAERVAGSRVALAQARSLLANLDDTSAIELAPVRLALDHIERRINQILYAGGYSG